MIDAHGVSEPGPVRKTNEDAFFSDPSLQLFIVADGLGGHAAGEVASKLAVDTVSSVVRRVDDDGELSWPYGIDPGLTFSGNVLRTAIHLANRRVFRAAEREDDYTGMATTIVAAFISGSRLAVANAGDSRLYMFSGGRLSQLTSDDTWAATIRATQGEASHPQSAATRSMRGVLTNVIGARDQAEVHMREFELAGGETLLLCSDGLHAVVEDGTLEAALATGGTPAEIALRLIGAAVDNGTRDNITALVVRYDGAES